MEREIVWEKTDTKTHRECVVSANIRATTMLGRV